MSSIISEAISLAAWAAAAGIVIVVFISGAFILALVESCKFTTSPTEQEAP